METDKDQVDQLCDEAKTVWKKPAQSVTDADLVAANAPGCYLRTRFTNVKDLVQWLDSLFPDCDPLNED